jgi:hypothetical protein
MQIKENERKKKKADEYEDVLADEFEKLQETETEEESLI